jgi:hypothetical protein
MVKSRRVRWAGYKAHIGEKANAQNVLIGKPEKENPPGRARCRWMDTIKFDLKERKKMLRCERDSSGSGQGPVTGSCEHSNEPSASI